MLNSSEKELYFYLHGVSGSFTTHLFSAIFKADTNNLYLLKQGFPEKVATVKRYQNEDGYAEYLESEMRK